MSQSRKPFLIINGAPVRNEENKNAREILTIKYEGTTVLTSLETIERNRVISHDYDNYLHICFGNLKYENDSNNEQYINHIKSILWYGVQIGDKLFKFCGHSNSQLRSKSCFLKAESSHSRIGQMINKYGDFSGINDVAKRSKRIGLYFSCSNFVVYLNPFSMCQIDDIEHNDQNFTNGCGIISESFAAEIAKKISNKIGYKGHNRDYLPKVFQIRYKGYKGTLMVEPKDKVDKLKKFHVGERNYLWLISKIYQDSPDINVLFRESMWKFGQCESDEMYILDYSKPMMPGNLNNELVSILSSLGISDNIFLRKLDEYLDFIGNAMYDSNTAIKFCEYKGNFVMADKIKEDKIRSNWENKPKWIVDKLRGLQTDQLKSSYDKYELERVHMRIQDSRLLFGVCDDAGKLQEGQCFVKITIDRKTLANSNVTGRILVGRNPCFHPGDVQVFTAVSDIPELEHLVDCIVFPTNGALPAAAQLSGGDLDGDKFFVCWDPELIPIKCYQPLDYSRMKPETFIPFTRNSSLWFDKQEKDQLDLIKYFAEYNNHILGSITRLYWEWIRLDPELRAFSNECLALNELYIKAVDGGNVDIPEDLRNPPKQKPNTPTFIIDKMTKRITEKLRWRFSDHHLDP